MSNRNLGTLWKAATLDEQRDLTRVLLKAMYMNVETERIVAIEPLPVVLSVGKRKFVRVQRGS